MKRTEQRIRKLEKAASKIQTTSPIIVYKDPEDLERQIPPATAPVIFLLPDNSRDDLTE
jgi:hypothetical protein